MKTQVQSLASLSGLRIWHCCKLWCSLQTWFGSGIAMAVVEVSSYKSNLTPRLGSSICHGCNPKKKIKKKEKEKTEPFLILLPLLVSFRVFFTDCHLQYQAYSTVFQKTQWEEVKSLLSIIPGLLSLE